MPKLLRANYQLGGQTLSHDFVGEGAEEQLHLWIADTAIQRDDFRYLGRELIHQPMYWKLSTDAKELEIWDGLLPIGSPDMLVKNKLDIEWFIEDYLGKSLKSVLGKEGVCENPGGFFSKDYIEAEEEVATTETIEEEKVMAKQKMSKFEEWFRTFIEEKDLPVVEWTYKKEGYIGPIIVDNYDAVEIIIDKMSPQDQQKVKNTIVKLDFVNGDINHFLKHIMDGYMEMVEEM